jgi:hypothetical protein
MASTHLTSALGEMGLYALIVKFQEQNVDDTLQNINITEHNNCATQQHVILTENNNRITQ